MEFQIPIKTGVTHRWQSSRSILGDAMQRLSLALLRALSA
jgi:hypothetical protein